MYDKPSVRIGMVVFNDGPEKGGMTEGEAELLKLVRESSKTVTSVEAWRTEAKEFGVQVVDDGLTMTGYFDKDGELLGDWF